MWYLLQAVGCALLTVALIYMRKNGLCLNSWAFYSIVNICFTSWIFPLVYKNAPSFFQAYFWGTAVLIVFGLIGSFWYFGEQLSVIKYFGAGLITLGAFLLI